MTYSTKEILKGPIGDFEYEIGLEVDLGITPILNVGLPNFVYVWSDLG